ncbi:MAG: hypothetical protein COA62_08690 [Rhodobiaceae bacterium]|nr:MAG: hypothetical protein COA62_08690 [Rhodobiaceae bacterium]
MTQGSAKRISDAQAASKRPNSDVLYDRSPSMGRQRPFLFIALLLAVPVFGIGVLALGYWYIKNRSQRLTIYPNRVVKRLGIVSKNICDVRSRDIAEFNINQTLFQRIMGIADIEIGTAATAEIEISIEGMPFPQKIQEFVELGRG